MGIYVPLATRYRPQRFADVVGQDLAVKIITRGMQKNRLGAALLFSGTRGIGKTTLARLLAKAFRCEHCDPEPCCQCDHCREFSAGGQMDVVEIDAASNTSVDDVREIIESCRYKPATGKFKIFIIDEVHMLSKSAFNALLKTLEEPPEHVKFLLATTETHKIPETILSRVLRFDLKPLDNTVVAQYLSSICNRENISADAEVLTLLAKAANGSLRDGLSILDQAINMSDSNRLSAKDIKSLLEISDDGDILELLTALAALDLKSVVEKYRKIVRSNVSPDKIAHRLLDYIYAVTCLKAHLEPLETTVPAEVLPQLASLTDKISLSSLTRIWQMLLKGIDELRICDYQETVLEMLLLRLVYAAGLPDIQDIVENLTNAKSEPSTGKASASTATATATAAATGSVLDEALKLFPQAKLAATPLAADTE
ncbi:MAG: DNA polymerase III subunit gamma/tau [Holosporaceae bacterium]|jgi:DNA polymerase-3 subunit gamma/tau|nr:DNA polymerase III subunit gamma/tau [Holosporaceae bacterium]